MTAYYNEIDPFAAQWLRNLIAAGQIAPGDVDERSIEDIRPDELIRYTQCHFFAGIGGWSYALRLAGWPDDRPVWTGSCPCQPFSAAGKGGGFADERHLWPAFHHLIRVCRPATVFGEQVASKDGLGWLDLVQADMEAEGYAFAANDLCAAGLGAPHIRQRLFWVADSNIIGRPPVQREGNSGMDCRGDNERTFTGPQSGESDVRLADAESSGRREELKDSRRCIEGVGKGEAVRRSRGGHIVRLADADDAGPQGRSRVPERADQRFVGEGCVAGRVADDEHQRHGGQDQTATASGKEQLGAFLHQRGDIVTERQSATGPTNGFWRNADWLYCRDGKWRPVEPGTFPLAHGLPARVGRLRGYGNAIVPQVAAEFVTAYLEEEMFL